MKHLAPLVLLSALLLSGCATPVETWSAEAADLPRTYEENGLIKPIQRRVERAPRERSWPPESAFDCPQAPPVPGEDVSDQGLADYVEELHSAHRICRWKLRSLRHWPHETG